MAREPTATAVRKTSSSCRTSGNDRFFARTAILLMSAAVILSSAFTIAECRSLQENNDHYTLRGRRGAEEDTRDYLSDGAAATGDDEEETDSSAGESVGASGGITPAIMTPSLVVESAEGTTVNLPCKVSEEALDDVALIWVNGTKTIMTDSFASTSDPRIKLAQIQSPTPGLTEHTLIVEQVTRYDSGLYTCRITSSPPVEITHTLRVTHPAKILSVQPIGAARSSNSGDGKKYSLKQGEPVQLTCTVAGFPSPTVQWTRRAKYQQQLAATQSPDQNPSSSQQPMTVVVSNTNEVRIESVSAYRDAGYYECTAHNSVLSGSATPGAVAAQSAARSGFELEIEYQPDVVVPRRVVNTGETYTAQMACSVHAFPKPKVTWEKKTSTSADGSESWQPLSANDGRDSRYEMTRPLSGSVAAMNSGNASTTPPGPTFMLKVKQVQGPQDFGLYRCRAENTLGVSYSEPISLTGSPARPQPKFVVTKPMGRLPELGWDVDSWSPLMEYQLQYRRQQDSLTSWTDVQPQPLVNEKQTNGGDEFRYSVSYVFGGEHQSQTKDVVPQTLQHGTTYVARLRARNVHGWSEWSADVVFSGGLDDGQWDNEITHQRNGGDHDKILKASATGGACSQQRLSDFVAAIVLAVALTIAAC